MIAEDHCDVSVTTEVEMNDLFMIMSQLISNITYFFKVEILKTEN